MVKVVSSVFPKAQYQTCLVHVSRNLSHKVRVSDREEVCHDFKIESFNKQIKKYTKRKEPFPNEEALERFLVSLFDEYNERFATRCHRGFDQARAELEKMFETKE